MFPVFSILQNCLMLVQVKDIYSIQSWFLKFVWFHPVIRIWFCNWTLYAWISCWVFFLCTICRNLSAVYLSAVCLVSQWTNTHLLQTLPGLTRWKTLTFRRASPKFWSVYIPGSNFVPTCRLWSCEASHCIINEAFVTLYALHRGIPLFFKLSNSKNAWNLHMNIWIAELFCDSDI